MPPTETTNGDRNAYPLNRDFLASARLNLQHHLNVSSVGYLLHPTIPLKENGLIAEVGCGTGIFSLELAKHLPSGSKIEAFDISLAQCPPKGWWPKNVTFNQLDIFEPIPEHLVGRYDVVCIRHFICVVQSGDPTALLNQLLKLLKPGGYLQWQEYDLQTNKIFLADPNASAPKLKAFMDHIDGTGTLKAQTSWVKTFHSRFAEELIACERHWSAKEVLTIRQEITFLNSREWCENLRAREGRGSKDAARLEVLTDEAHEECLALGRGSVIDNQLVTWVLRKG